MASLPESFVDVTQGEAPVRGFLHEAGSSCADFLVLTHGAGGNCNTALLVDLGKELSDSGINVLRCDLPFRQRKPTGPPSPATAKADQEGLRRALTLMKQRFSGRAFLGGSSYGGRQASMLIAEDASFVAGLLLLSYPLHPPGRPAQLRTAHFPNLRVPSLFVSGTRDAFGSIEEMQQAIRIIPVATRLVPIQGAAHGLQHKSNREGLTKAIIKEFQSFFA
jgi:predicted alpha/beta-hydrolase family hydrolase